MQAAFFLTIVFLVAAPLSAAAGITSTAPFSILAALAALFVAARPPHDLASVGRLLRRFLLVLLFPIALLIAQMLPIPLFFANSVWLPAWIALNAPNKLGHISVDLGATLDSLLWYLTLIMIFVSSLLVSIDRRRARRLITIWAAISSLLAAAALAVKSNWFALPYLESGTSLEATALLALIANMAMVAKVIEGHFKRGPDSEVHALSEMGDLIPGLLGFAVSLAAGVALKERGFYILAALGFSTMVLVAVARSLNLSPWTSAISFLALLTLVGAIEYSQLLPLLGLSTALPSSIPKQLVESPAILAASWIGTGAGTFNILVDAYQGPGATTNLGSLPTAFVITVEFGRIALWLFILAALRLLLFQVRGAVARGRDSYIPSATAATMLVSLCLAFVDASLLTPFLQIVLAILLGLGVAQSMGRTSTI